MEDVNTCPKCNGNVFVECDQNDGEWYEYCLQCSYRHYLPSVFQNEKKKVTSPENST